MPANVTGSVPATPNSMPPSALPTATAPASPSASPTAASFRLSPTTSPKICRSRRAERQAHADLLRPLRDRVGHHAVDPDRREHQRQPREDRDQRRVEARAADRVRDQLVHRRDARDRDAGIELLDRAAQRFGQRRGIAGGLQDDVDARFGICQ